MKHGRKYLLFTILVVIMLSVIFLLTSCAPPTQETISGQAIGKEMFLIGQYEDIQVFKVIDNIAKVTCYVTINSQRYEPSNIFCIK